MKPPKKKLNPRKWPTPVRQRCECAECLRIRLQIALRVKTYTTTPM